MPKVVFKFDLEKDAWNYYNCANSDSCWGEDFTRCLRPEVLKKLKGKKWSEVKKNTLGMLKRGYAQDEERDKKKLKELQNSWNKINDEYFKRLAKITKHKIYTNKFTSYITTIGRCPYYPKKNWFMTNLFWSVNKSLMTSAHELMHLQFHFYFEEKLRKN
ncbi:MAG: hypothetical protein KKF68_02180, partial [Nanoarchaeota archaeon]|nr:hypothetical protein [Nanoarchaeota archaeon]